MTSAPSDDYLERVKAEIRAEAELARARTPLPRHEPPPREQASSPTSDGIDRSRLDYSIGELVASEHRAFLDDAFRALLKRPPDDAGSTLQVRVLAAGGSKAEVLGNLRWSPEGRRIATRVPGLRPRYLLAKATRVPVLGYFLEWMLAFAGLPLLLRHQRAAATALAARFEDAADVQRGHEDAMEALRTAHAVGLADHGAQIDGLRHDIARMLKRLDELEGRSARLEARATAVERSAATTAQALPDLRHHVHAVNHWVASVQSSLGELEDHASADRRHADALFGSIAESPAHADARLARHAHWSGILASRLPGAARVLDLGSGDGAWLASLRAHGIMASGVEANGALASRVRSDGAVIAQGDPLAALEHCADASLDAVCIARDLLDAGAADAASYLRHSLRTLKAGGTVLVRLEPTPADRLGARPDAIPDASAWTALLDAAGFMAASAAPSHGSIAVFAQCPDA